jgi:hypothetical protein
MGKSSSCPNIEGALKMKAAILSTAAALLLSCAALPASAKTNCESVIAQIEAKLAAKGVTKYTLLIIAKDETTELRVVGICEGGAKKIVYKRG